jgi:hypothetical protein
MRQLGGLLVGLYVWTVTTMFGATVVDVVYAAQVPGRATGAQAEVADFLLVLAGLTVLAAIAAVAASWEWTPARWPIVASLAFVVLGLVGPALLLDVVREAETASGVRLGPWLRVGFAGLASLLAFLGPWAYWRKA